MVKKIYYSTLQFCQRMVAPRWVNLVAQKLHQGSKFLLFLYSAVFHGLALFSRQPSLWFPLQFHRKTWQIPWEEEGYFYPVFKLWEVRGGKTSFPEASAFFSVSLLTRHAPVLMLKRITDKQENHSFPVSTWPCGRCWMAKQNGYSVSKKDGAEYLLSGHNI